MGVGRSITIPVCMERDAALLAIGQAAPGLCADLVGLGVTNFNTMLYLGLQTTTASNSVLLLSVTPLVILFFSWTLLAIPATKLQLLGILVSLAGVIMIISKGELVSVSGFSVVVGDLWILGSVASWGLYSVLLRKRPAGLDGLPLLGYTILFGLFGILPFYLWETLGGRPMSINGLTFMSVAYVAIFASLLAYMFWNHAVTQIGANRAGLFIHLIPLFGSLLSVLILGERLHSYHLKGILLIATGIVLAAVRRSSST